MLFSLALAILAADTSSLVPFNDLCPQPYMWGYYGGMYDDKVNPIPADHLAAGMQQAARIRPIDEDGQPSTSGKVVFLSAGFGETARIFCTNVPWAPCEPGSFMAMAAADRRVNHDSLVILNAAHTGFDANSWIVPYAGPNLQRIHDQILVPNGVTEKQVQAAWIQLENDNPVRPLPIQDADAYRLKQSIAVALRTLKLRYPNLQIAYLSSRVYGGYATTSWNPEPFAYESVLSVRWVIAGQVTLMRTGFLWDTRIGDVDYLKGTTPWVAWGPYFWANGTKPRSDGLTWERDDFEADGESLSEKGAHKGANLLLDFMLHEPTAAGWFLGPNPPPRRRVIR